jgi:thiol-disulfide isomerase/thioredoxin
MKRILLTITQITCYTLFCLTTSAQQKKGGYSITGTVNGMADGKVYISHSIDNKEITDSTVIKDGKFMFTGTTPGPYQHFIRFEHTRRQVGIFVENKPIRIDTDTSFQDIRVTGSGSHQLYREFIDIFGYIHQKAGIPNRKFQQAAQTKDSVLHAEAKKEWDAIGVEADSLFTDFVRRHPASPVAPYVIIDRFINYLNPLKIEECYKLLKPEALNSTYGKQVSQFRLILARTAIGVKPSFTMADTTGKKVSLRDFQGQYVLVDFWASWCGPCRKENPNVVKAYEKYHAKGFEVVAISLDDKRAPWIKAIHTDGLPWIHLSDLKGWKSELAAMYGITSIPASFLVDKEGKIIAKNLRGKDLEAKLEELLP